MKILFANYRYFISGGPERYMFNASEALRQRGHEILPFSIRYSRNEPTPYSKYFVSPLGNEDEVYFRDQRKDLRTLYKTTKRLFYDKEVEKAVMKITADTKPDVAYVLHYLRKLSPSLLVGLKKKNIPIVVRLSDYGMLCPQVHFLRDGKPCVKCINGNLWPSVRHGCVQNSKAISFVNYIATMYHRHKNYFGLIDKFITTNDFMYQKMVEAGYPQEKMVTIPTFVDTETFHPPIKKEMENLYIIYIGRLEEIKGVHVLIEAWRKFLIKNPNIPLQLKIIGFGSDDYTKEIENLISRTEKISFIGRLDEEEVAKELRGAYLSIIPSLWYENLPNTLLESYASGIPVIASNLGSLKESVIDGKLGFLFEPGNSGDLAQKIEYCIAHPQELSIISKRVRRLAEQEYSAENHITKLQNEFIALMSLLQKPGL